MTKTKTEQQLKIELLKTMLHELVTDWKEDRCSPPNFIRETGDGEEIARVDVWCGGYQDVHFPEMVGWRCQKGSTVHHGVILTEEPMSKQDCEKSIHLAKTQADITLQTLGFKIHTK